MEGAKIIIPAPLEAVKVFEDLIQQCMAQGMFKKFADLDTCRSAAALLRAAITAKREVD